MKSNGDSDRSEHRDTRLRFEHWARNPRCHANTLSAVHGISMSEVAKAEGIHAYYRAVSLALTRGRNFERVLLRNAAQRLRDALVSRRCTAGWSTGALGFPTSGQWRSDAHFGRRAKGNRRPLKGYRSRSRRGTAKPAIIGGATVRLPGQVMLPEAILIMDVLAVRYESEPVTLMVGEIKSYPDRGGYTDSAELATARAQAGVYVHGLRTALTEFGITDKLVVSDQGFLVLSRPGSNQPSVRAGEDLRFQAWRADRGFKQLEEAARDLLLPGIKIQLRRFRMPRLPTPKSVFPFAIARRSVSSARLNQATLSFWVKT